VRDQYLWTVAVMANTLTVTPVAASTMKRSLMFAVLAVFTALTSEETDRIVLRGEDLITRWIVAQEMIPCARLVGLSLLWDLGDFRDQEDKRYETLIPLILEIHRILFAKAVLLCCHYLPGGHEHNRIGNE